MLWLQSLAFGSSHFFGKRQKFSPDGALPTAWREKHLTKDSRKSTPPFVICKIPTLPQKLLLFKIQGEKSLCPVGDIKVSDMDSHQNNLVGRLLGWNGVILMFVFVWLEIILLSFLEDVNRHAAIIVAYSDVNVFWKMHELWYFHHFYGN